MACCNCEIGPCIQYDVGDGLSCFAGESFPNVKKYVEIDSNEAKSLKCLKTSKDNILNASRFLLYNSSK